MPFANKLKAPAKKQNVKVKSQDQAIAFNFNII